jgi:transposase
MNRKRIRTGGSLSWEEREAMIKEYLTGQYSKIELWKKYTGQETEHGQLLNWMRKLGYISEDKKSRPVKLFYPTLFPLSNSNTEDTNALQRRIKELEKQLENAQLKAEGYELMIEIAEKELKIPIRKKSGTK